jgi:hypothetical protein
MVTTGQCYHCGAAFGAFHRPDCAVNKIGVRPSPPISSEDSTTTDQQELKRLHAAADKLLHYKLEADRLQSLTGMPPSEFWPTAVTAMIELTSGQILSGMERLTRSLSASKALDQPHAPSSQASTATGASDAPTQDESPAPSSLGAKVALQAIEVRMERLQGQINTLAVQAQALTGSTARRLAALETEFAYLTLQLTSVTTPSTGSTTSPVERTEPTSTSSSASSRSTSKQSRRPKPTKAATGSSSAKRKLARSGATSLSPRGKRSGATPRLS